MTPKDIHELLVVFGVLVMVLTAAQFTAAAVGGRPGLAFYLGIVQFIVVTAGTTAAYLGYRP